MGSTTTQPSTLHQFNGTQSTIEDMKILNTELSYDKHMNTKNTLHILLYIALLVLLMGGKYASDSIMALHHDLTFIMQTEVNSKARPRNES